MQGNGSTLNLCLGDTHHMKATTDDPFLTVAGAAEYLGVSKKCIYTWLYARVFPSVRLGRAVRIRLSDLEAFIAAGTTPARSEGQ